MDVIGVPALVTGQIYRRANAGLFILRYWTDWELEQERNISMQDVDQEWHCSWLLSEEPASPASMPRKTQSGLLVSEFLLVIFT
jgi:hypothetical protein